MDPYAPPTAEVAPEPSAAAEATRGAGDLPRVWAEGPNLCVRLGATIPAVCLKCGVTTGIVRREHAFTWMPPEKRRNTLAMQLLFGALGGALMEAANAKHRRNATLSLPLCEPCDQRWAQGKKLAIVTLLLFFACFGFVLFAQSERLMGPLALLVFFFGSLGALVAIARFVVPPRYVHAERIEDDFIVLRRVAPLAVTEAVRRAGKKKRKGQASLVDDGAT